MKEITILSILNEYNISVEKLQALLNENNFALDINIDSTITQDVFDNIKENIISNNKTNTYTENNNETLAYSTHDKDSTQVYIDNNESSTQTYNEDRNNKTNVYNTNSNNSSGEVRTLSHNLGIGDSVILKDINYFILDIISEGTGEAIIYKINDEFKNIYALKLYFEFANLKHEPNAETLERIKKIKHKDILKLIDYGVGFEKYQNKYCFEISEYAEGGDLLNVTDFRKKYTPDFIEKHVIPEIFDGINQLHSNKIYHCDLKPGNIFYLDKDQKNLIIGDYGSAKAYDIEETKEVIKTSTVKGSNFYLAPEQSRGLVSDKNDYYSFGMIILHLLYPEKFTVKGDFKRIDNTLFEQIVERGDSSVKLIDYDPTYVRINRLIEGLTLNVRKNRWGKNEVEKWIKKEDSDLQIKYLNSTESKIIKINLSGDKIIQSELQLLDFVYTTRNWKEELLEDITTKNELDNWLNVNYKKDKRVEINTILKYTELNIDSKITKEIKFNEGIDYTKEAFIRYLKPEFPIAINETLFKIAEGSINEKVTNLISKLDQVWQTLSLEKIRFFLFQLEFSLKQLLKSSERQSSMVLQTLITKIYSSLDINNTDLKDFKSEIVKVIIPNEIEKSQSRILNLFQSFNQERVFNYNRDKCKNLEELGLYIANNENRFKNSYFKAEKNWFLKKENKLELANLESKELVFEIFKDEANSTIEYISLSFDKHRVYDINYKYYKSLTDHLRENNISIDYTSRSDTNETYSTNRNLFEKFGVIADKFIRETKTKHNISSISKDNENNIKSKIVSDSWKQYLKVYQGQVVALGCLLLTLILIGVYNSNNSFTPSSSHQITNTQESTLSINRDAYIKADPIGNIRSGTSTKSAIMTSLNKGEKVYVIEQDKATNWYLIRYGNTTGYISNNLISFINPANNSTDKTTLSLNKQFITGYWNIINENSSYYFNSNGTGSYKNSRGNDSSFKWSLTGSNIKIIMNNDGSLWKWQVNSYSSNRIEMYNSSQNIKRIIVK